LNNTIEAEKARTKSDPNPNSRLSAVIRNTTSALPETWGQILDWSHDHSVSNEFFLVINSTGLTSHPQALGRVFAALDSNVAKQLLEKWRFESEYAQTIYRLSIARSAQDPRLVACRSLTDVVPATAHITEHIATFYLLGLLLARLPVVEHDEHRNWFERLRLWLFTHCLERTALGNPQDKHLEIACSKLRLAHDGSKGWLELFGKLRTDSLGFEGIGVHLASRAQQLLDTQSGEEALTHTQQSLLEALILVARHEHAPKAGEGVFPIQINEQNPRSGKVIWDLFEETQTDTERPDPEDPSPAILIPGTGESSDLLRIGVDEKASYAHQQFQANSILLSAAEDLHFLPWSWNRPNPIELPLLATWLRNSFASPAVEEKAVATFSLIALMTGRSLRRALDISLGSVPGQEWTLDLEAKRLLRTPPRRIPGWAPDNHGATSWIAPMADVCVLPLPDSAANFLLGLDAGINEPRSRGDLWSSVWGDSPESAFLKAVQITLPRLSPAMLGNALAQHTYLQKGDGVFARLLSSHPRTGLPGATAYSSWGHPEVDASLASFLGVLGFADNIAEPAGEPLNALGSQLAVLEHMLASAIEKLNCRVEEVRQSGSLIDFHNALTAKLLIKIYAATGARPLRDPFCSPRQFGFEDGTLFIDDKHSRKARTGRLVPLPMSLITEVQHSYLKHLSCIANALKASAPELSTAMATLAQGQESDRLPFFFLLATGPGKISWRHASEKHLRDLDLFDCPLPLNLFRHRLATRLRQDGVDPELIDALLGHAESGASTHGDHSFRIWKEDMASLRALLESCLDALDFTKTEAWLLPAEALDVTWESGTTDLYFGAKARAHARRERIQAAISSAKGIIKAHQKGRALNELAKTELDTLARALLTNETGLPHPLGALRFSVLINAANELNREAGKKVRFSHRYQQLEEETSPFSPDGPGATSVLTLLQCQIGKLIPDLTKLRLGKMDAAIIAVALLIVQSRIADRALLRDVLAGQNIRLIRARPGFYLEHGLNLSTNDPAAPVHRHRISNAAARLVNMALNRSQQRSFDDLPVPAPLLSIANNLVCAGRLRQNARVPHLIASLTSVTDQANIQTLPGVVAGYLGGRVESASLEWRDWSRLRWNRRIAVDSAGIDLPPESPDDDLPSRMPEARDIELLQKEARNLFSEIGKHLDPDPTTSSLTPNARRDIKSAIRRTLAAADGRAPRACLLLGAWVASLMERKSGHDGFLARNAIKRYFGALSPAFAEVGYAIDLELADEDEMTEFYSEVIEGRELRNPQYVFARLKEFHRWLAEQVEVEDPVWAELPCHDGAVPVDPGIVVESDYLRAFNFLAGRAADKEKSRYAALLLLGAYRFGLRGGEVFGLLRSDWISIGDYITVVVQNNRYRRLKRKSSRRVVPLLMSLKASEAALINWATATAEARCGDDCDALLFPSANRKLQQQLRRLALDALKSATGNPASNLHRLRHAAANDVMRSLAGIELPAWQQASTSGVSEACRTQELLLGRKGPTRRASWASARYLGHAGLRTAFQSYYHFISDLAEQCIALPEESPRQYEHAVDLTRFPVLPLNKPVSSPADSSQIYGRAETVIKSLRLLARGKTEEEVSDWMGWDPKELKCLITAVKEINIKIARQEQGDSEAPSAGIEWLKRIRNHGWNRMLRLVEKVDQKLIELKSPAVSIICARRMIGSSRQLLAWRREHFLTLSLVRDLWNIRDDQYALLMTGDSDRMKGIATGFGFEPGDPKRQGRRAAGQQIDAAFDDDEKILRVATRCALCLKDSDDSPIRNRFELIVALLSVSCAGDTDTPEKTPSRSKD
jgi:integrase